MKQVNNNSGYVKYLYITKGGRIYKVELPVAIKMLEEEGYSKSSKEQYKEQRRADKSAPVETKIAVRTARVKSSHNNRRRFAYSLKQNDTLKENGTTAIVRNGNIIGHTSTEHTGYKVYRQDRFKSFANKYCHQEIEPIAPEFKEPKQKISVIKKAKTRIEKWLHPIRNVKQYKVTLPAYKDIHTIAYGKNSLDVVVDLPETYSYITDTFTLQNAIEYRINTKIAELKEGFIKHIQKEEEHRNNIIQFAEQEYKLNISDKTIEEMKLIINILENCSAETVYDNVTKVERIIFNITGNTVMMVDGKKFSVRTLFTPRFTFTNYANKEQLQTLFAQV